MSSYTLVLPSAGTTIAWVPGREALPYGGARVVSMDDGHTWAITLEFDTKVTLDEWWKRQPEPMREALYTDGKSVYLARIRAELPVVFAMVEAIVKAL